MKGHPPFTGPAGSPPPPSADPIALLNYALTKHPGKVQLVDFASTVVVVELLGLSAEEEEAGERPRAEVTVDAPLVVGRNLNGPDERRDCYLLIHIERSVADEMDDPSPIILLPGGANGRL